ncbi:MAG: hypothetical protein ACO3SJ_04925 [Phycisphaerales bacterium]
MLSGITLPLLATTAPVDPSILQTLDEVSQGPVESRALAVSLAIGQMTGLALSPVLVLGLFGLWDWTRLDGDVALPLHAQPWLWGPLLTLSILAALGRTGSLTVPGAKYLIDVPQQINSKVTGLVSAGIFLPTVASSLEAAGLSGSEDAIARAGFGAWGLGAIALTSFVSVWIVSNTVDALRFLSPFAVVDATLTAARAALLAVVMAAISIDSFLGFPLLTLLVCVPLVIGCGLIAGACIRLNLFAMACSWDMLTRRWRRTDATSGTLRAFVARRHVGAPVRTMGRLDPSAGRIRFEWRPFFVMPVRSIEMRTERPTLTRGVVWSVVSSDVDGEPTPCFAFPPRYRGHEPAVATRLGAAVTDGIVLRGLKGTVQFVRGMFGFGERMNTATA